MDWMPQYSIIMNNQRILRHMRMMFLVPVRKRVPCPP